MIGMARVESMYRAYCIMVALAALLDAVLTSHSLGESVLFGRDLVPIKVK